MSELQSAPIAAHTVAEFCLIHRISRSKLYQMWEQGRGPVIFRVGNSIRISTEAAAAWRRAREAESAAATPPEAA